MAKSANYFGLRTGSTKSLTFSVYDGKQITKDRVERCKNPRTYPQMSQRCMVGTVGSAYAAMKSICNHSFEEKTAGIQCMREFMSENLKQIQLCKEYENGFFGFNKYQESGLVPGSYVLSKGSLPDACPDASILSINVPDKQITVEVATGSSIAKIKRAMGCRNYKDTCTIMLMYPKADGSYGFGAVCFTYKEGDTVLDSFSVEGFGDVVAATPTFASNTLKVEVRMLSALASGATTANTYMAAIASRMVNGDWRRSNAQFDVQDARPTFAEAIATYPIGEERILNGGGVPDFELENEGASPDPSQGGGNSGGTNTGDNTGGNTGGGTGTIDTGGGGNTGGTTGGDEGNDGGD